MILAPARWAATLAAWMLSTAIGSASAQTSFAALSGVSTISPCPSFCGGPGSAFASDVDGGSGVAASAASLANPDGNGRAAVQLSGVVGLPVLKAEAFASTTRSSQVQADATGMQGFYVGSGGLSSYALELALTGQATGSVRADVLVFRDLDPASLPLFSSGRGTMEFEVIPLTGDLELVQGLSLSLSPNGTAQSLKGTVDIENLAVGDLFYVWAKLSAIGRNGTYGDAFHTLNLSFTDAAGLSQLAPVPEPQAWALFVAGAAVLAARRRSRRMA